MKKSIRKIIRNIILEEVQSGMKQKLRTSYNKELTFLEKLKFLLGVRTNFLEFLDDYDAMYKVVFAAIKDKEEESFKQFGRSKLHAVPKELLQISSDLIVLKNELNSVKMNFESDDGRNELTNFYIQAINGNISPAALKEAEKNYDKQGFTNDIYDFIDIVHYLLELDVLTGYELSIEEYIKLGEKAAREGYTSSSYSGNKSFDF